MTGLGRTQVDLAKSTPLPRAGRPIILLENQAVKFPKYHSLFAESISVDLILLAFESLV